MLWRIIYLLLGIAFFLVFLVLVITGEMKTHEFVNTGLLLMVLARLEKVK